MLHPAALLTEPENADMKTKRRDLICEHIKRLPHPIDWNSVKQTYQKPSQKLKHAFETRCIHCILTSDTPASEELIKSLIEYIKSQPKDSAADENPVFQLHQAALYASLPTESLDTNSQNIIRDSVLKIAESHSHMTKFKAYSIALSGMASISAEDCELAVRLAFKDNTTKKLLWQHCLTFGLHDLAMDCFELKRDVEMEMKPWFTSFEQFDFGEETFRRFMNMMRTVAGPWTPYVGGSAKRVLLKAGYKFTDTQVDGESSLCAKCGSQIPGISEEEYDSCIQLCEERVLKRGDVFINSRPHEVKSFLQMIHKKVDSDKYYDVVIDALNVAHISQPSKFVLDPEHPLSDSGRIVKVVKDKKILTTNLSRVLNVACQRFDHVLLLGKKHMMNWPNIKQTILAKRDKVDTFLLEGDSKDDPFIIYAAMQTPHTYVMSNDFYRDHSFLISDELFERWLMTRIIRVPKDVTTLLIPPKHENRVAFSSDWSRIHVPFGFNNASFIQWICCHKQ